MTFMNASLRKALPARSAFTSRGSVTLAAPSVQCPRFASSAPSMRKPSVQTASSSTMVASSNRKTDDYNKTMAKQMGWDANPYEYHYERGLYYHEVHPGLLCGSMPRNAGDVDQLEEMGVTAIINLQQDKDLQYWGVSLDEIKNRCKHHNLKLIRRPARDFDPHSVRKTIPGAIQSVHNELKAGGKVYVHCTAGLGRAPAVCIAYIHWFSEPHMCLDTAYQHLTSIRPCGPKKDAIRGATYDMMSGQPFDHFEKLPKDSWLRLDESDRYALQYRILRHDQHYHSHPHHNHHHHHH